MTATTVTTDAGVYTDVSSCIYTTEVRPIKVGNITRHYAPVYESFRVVSRRPTIHR